jgi:hypothetical protein
MVWKNQLRSELACAESAFINFPDEYGINGHFRSLQTLVTSIRVSFRSNKKNITLVVGIWTKLFSRAVIFKPGIRIQECQCGNPGRSVSLFGEYYFCFSLIGIVFILVI